MSPLTWGQIRVHFSEDHQLPGQTLRMHPAINEAYRGRYHRDCLQQVWQPQMMFDGYVLSLINLNVCRFSFNWFCGIREAF